MDKQVAIRRVRVAGSVFFGVLAVVLCVLWARSYWREYEARFGQFIVGTANGVVLFSVRPGKPQLEFYSRTVSNETENYLSRSTILGFGPYPQFPGVFLPYWFLAFGSIFASARILQSDAALNFSLRTMLVATTLVAVVLGLALSVGR